MLYTSPGFLRPLAQSWRPWRNALNACLGREREEAGWHFISSFLSLESPGERQPTTETPIQREFLVYKHLHMRALLIL